MVRRVPPAPTLPFLNNVHTVKCPHVITYSEDRKQINKLTLRVRSFSPPLIYGIGNGVLFVIIHVGVFSV